MGPSNGFPVATMIADLRPPPPLRWPCCAPAPPQRAASLASSRDRAAGAIMTIILSINPHSIALPIDEFVLCPAETALQQVENAHCGHPSRARFDAHEA